MAMISQSHHRLLPLSLSDGAAAELLDVTTEEAAVELLVAGVLLSAELDGLGVGVGVGDGVGEGVGVGGGAVTSKLATPTVPDS